MLSNNKEVNYLIHLMSCALNQKEPKINENIDFNSLLELSKKHQVYNIIFPLIMDLNNVSDKDKKEYKSYHYNEISKMIVMNNVRNIIFEEISKEQIKFMPLKGLILKNYYPKESMRQMSDNDILYDVAKRETLFEIMKKWNFKISSTSENSDDFCKPPFCSFEFHRNLFFDELDFHPNFDYVWDNAIVDNENQYQYKMNVNDVYLYSIAHMYKHFSTAGCGVRFLADVYVLLKKENDNLDWEYINEKLTEFGILEYEKESRELAINLFDEKNLTDNQFELFKIYMKSGIYGKQKVAIERAVNKIKNIDNTNVFVAKLQYMIKRLYPPKKQLIQDNKILETKSYLVPWYYFIRPFKALKNYKTTKNELNSLKKTK